MNGFRLWRSISKASRSVGRRQIHTPRALHFDPEQGLGDFLTPQGCKAVAQEFQNGLLDRINELIHGTPFENLTLAQTVIQSSTEREHALLFKYSSLALNNSFFLENLRPPSETPSEPGLELTRHITNEFGSQMHLQSSMSAAADGMSASGWIWLVSDQQGHLGIIPTYGSGTLLIRARQQRRPPIRGELPEPPQPTTAASTMHPSHPRSSTFHSQGPETTTLPTSGAIHRPPPPLAPREQQSRSINLTPSGTGVSSFYMNSSSFSHDNKRGVVLNPLLCISVYEHAWLSSGYGIWDKKEYLRRFWSVVDWEQVTKNYDYWKQIQLIENVGVETRHY